MLINDLCSRCIRNIKLFVRYKHKPTHWSVLQNKKTATDKALEHFNEFYQHIYKKNWPGIRQGLLGKQKYVAVVNNFSDSEEIKTHLENNGALNIRTLFNLQKRYITENHRSMKRRRTLERIWEMAEQSDIKESKEEQANNVIEENCSLEKSLEHAEYDTSRIIDCQTEISASNLYEFIPATKIKGKEDFIPESTHYQFYSNSEFATTIEKEYVMHFPEQLNVYCYEIGNHSDFLPPKRGSTGVNNYYLMDGGSLLPILALDLKPGNNVLDMCASPGGKSLLIFQTLYPDIVVSNDSTMSRVKRIYNVMRQYLYDLDERWLKTKKLKVTCVDGRLINDEDFDRILVDVPCTTDRHSLIENDNNIFKTDRLKERLKLPELQSQLLVRALKLISNGGIVVYSTCSLSPIQNDGVVHMALKQIWEETKIQIVVKDLSPALIQTQDVYRLADQKLMRYGHLVVPNLQVNFGPTYFCKLQRVK